MSSTDVTDPRHAAARRHLQSGAIGPARQLFDALLDERPDDPDLLNDAALAYAHDGDAARAEAYLRRALEARPDHETAVYNLLDLLTGQRDDRAAREVFTTYADRLPDSDDKDRYRERLGNPLPAHQGDGAPVDDRDTDTLRIAFVCGPDRKFITDIEREIGKRHEVRTAYFDGEVNLQQIQHLMDWADVTWFEWAYKILMYASNRLRKTSCVVTRLHRWEAFQDTLEHINWSFVDTLIPTTHHITQVVRDKCPSIDDLTEIKVISSTVDLDQFHFRERDPGFNIAFVGYLNYRKNPSLLLQCLRGLIQEDDRYHLHLAGEFQQPELRLYFEHMLDVLNLSDHVTLHGWVDDVTHWLDDKDYLILPTMHEGNPYSVLEAAAKGIRPLVHSFPGAAELYPEDWIFTTAKELVQRIVSDPYEPKSYREHVASRFGLKPQTERINNLITSLAQSTEPISTSIFDGNTLQGVTTSVTDIHPPADQAHAGDHSVTLPTVVIPVYDRLKFLRQYLSEDYWNDLPLLLSCDGSPPEFMEQVKRLADERDNVSPHHHTPNQGAAVARHMGARAANSDLIICCDDDDFFGDAVRFAQECAAIFHEENDTLLVANPTMYTLHENGRLEKGYGFDKRRFDGLSGRDLLKKLVKLGEPHGLNNGACYRRNMFLSVPIPPFIFPEDYGYLIRICTAYPNHIARVANTGTFFRLRSESGITHDITLTKLLETFLYQCEGAMTLIENNEMTRSEFKAIIADRGRQIQKVRGWGQEAFHTFNRLIQGEAPAQFKSDESRATIEFIRSTYPDLPTVYDYFLTQRVRSALNLNNDSHRIALAN
jgi:glycosyltransferase involved in cell wall biosynthesis